jgi:hypothetical protein
VRRNVATLNQQIAADPDLGEGFLIGHSFFCVGDGETRVDANWFQSIIDTEIAPLVREYWFDKKGSEVDAAIAVLRRLA